MAIDSIQLPVHGSTAVEILKHDHQAIARLLAALMRAATPEDRRDALKYLKAALVVHNATEENIVYPALEALAGQKVESQKLYHDTAEADVLIFELDGMLQAGAATDFDSKVTKLHAAVIAHVASEENSAFPDLEAHATSQQLEALTSSVREFRTSFQFNPSS